MKIQRYYTRLAKVALWILLCVECAPLQAQTVTERIDSTVQRAMTANNVPGMSVAIIKDGTIAFAKGYGLADRERNIPVTTQTRFAIASVSKTMTAVALMQLVDAGQVRLDADINTYLPFQVRNPTFPNTPITVQMVLSHTSSLSDGSALFGYVVPGDSPITLADFMRRSLSSDGDLFGQTAEFSMKAPGAEFKYCNMNTALLGYIVEVVARQPFNQYCNQRLFTPLCMNNTRWFLSELDSTTVAVPYIKNGSNLVRRPYTGFPDYPDGQIRTNVLDMSKFIWSLLNNGGSLSGGQPVLRPETLRRMLSPIAPSGSIGLHFFYTEIASRDSSWGHAGGLDDATAEMHVLRSENVGVVFMANAAMSSANAGALWQDLMTIGRDITPNPRNPVQCTLATSVREERSHQAEAIEITPNPVVSDLILKTSLTGVSVRVIDVLGNEVFAVSNTSSPLTISLEHLARGTYFLIASRSGSVITTQKILKL